MKEAIVPPKRRFLQDPHGVTSQKTAFFIVTAVRTGEGPSELWQILFVLQLCTGCLQDCINSSTLSHALLYISKVTEN
jgi:hypothetical protein